VERGGKGNAAGKTTARKAAQPFISPAFNSTSERKRVEQEAFGVCDAGGEKTVKAENRKKKRQRTEEESARQKRGKKHRKDYFNGFW